MWETETGTAFEEWRCGRVGWRRSRTSMEALQSHVLRLHEPEHMRY